MSSDFYQQYDHGVRRLLVLLADVSSISRLVLPISDGWHFSNLLCLFERTVKQVRCILLLQRTALRSAEIQHYVSRAEIVHV